MAILDLDVIYVVIAEEKTTRSSLSGGKRESSWGETYNKSCVSE